MIICKNQSRDESCPMDSYTEVKSSLQVLLKSSSCLAGVAKPCSSPVSLIEVKRVKLILICNGKSCVVIIHFACDKKAKLIWLNWPKLRPSSANCLYNQMPISPWQQWEFIGNSFPSCICCKALQISHFQRKTMGQRKWQYTGIKTFAHVLPLLHELNHIDILLFHLFKYARWSGLQSQHRH